jgi:CubicO group peptidase (beta-lactamase class C family)
MLALLWLLTFPAQEPLREAADAAARPSLESRKHGGFVVGILLDGRSACFGYGKTSDAAADPPGGDTVFEIGSITKAFTGILLAGMANEKLVALEDPVGKHLPEGTSVPSRGGKEITLLHLATHTSGLPRMPGNFRPKDPLNPYADYDAKQLFEFLAAARLARDPGEAYEYSNLGSALLGHALVRRSGKASYEALVTEKICRPLGMNDTVVTLSEDQKRRLAPPHRPDGKAVKNWDLPAFAGAGALRSTAGDMLRFLAANLGGAPRDLAEAVTTSHAPRTPKTGLGWHFTPRSGGAWSVWHNGGTGGYASFCGFVKEKRAAVVVLSNTSQSVDEIGLRLLERIAK